MRLTILAASLALAVVFTAARAQQVEGEQPPVPLVTVDGHAITSEDLARQTRLDGWRPPPAGGSMTALERDALDLERRRLALRELVDGRLLYNRARREYLAGPGAEQVLKRVGEEELKKLEERVGSMLKARLVLADLDLSVGQYKELRTQSWLADKLMWEKALSPVNVSPAEARAYYTQNLADFRAPRTIVFRQILFDVVDDEDLAARRAEAEAVLEELRTGADFAELADRRSADAAGYPGGLHRTHVTDPESTWMPRIVVDLEPGQVSDVRRVDGGFAIGKLEAVLPPRTAPFDEVQGDLKARLLQRKRAAVQASFLRDLRREGGVVYLPGAAHLRID